MQIEHRNKNCMADYLFYRAYKLPVTEVQGGVPTRLVSGIVGLRPNIGFDSCVLSSDMEAMSLGPSLESRATKPPFRASSVFATALAIGASTPLLVLRCNGCRGGQR